MVELLLGYQEAVMLSGYATALYRPLEEAGWTRVERSWSCHAAGHPSRRPGLSREELRRVECVWRNPEAMARIAATGAVGGATGGEGAVAGNDGDEAA